MALGYEVAVVAHFTELVGVLHHHSKVLLGIKIKVVHIASNNLYVARSGIGAHHVESLGQEAVVHKDFANTIFLGLAAALGKKHQHTLATGSGLVQQTGIAQGHAGHLAHHGLVGHQSLQATLADFSLIGGIGGIPSGVLKNIALDDTRSDRIIIAHADIGLEQFVLVGQLTAAVEEFILIDAIGYGHRFFQTNGCGHSLVNQFVDGANTDFLQHFFLFGSLAHTIVSLGKIVANHIVIINLFIFIHR